MIILPEALGLACFFTLPAVVSFIVVLANKFPQVLGVFSLYFRPVFDKLGVDRGEVLASFRDMRHDLIVPAVEFCHSQHDQPLCCSDKS